MPGVSFPQLAHWLALPYLPGQGWGALALEFTVARGALAGVRIGMDLRETEVALGDGLPPLRLSQVRGQAIWQRDADGQRVAFENLRVALPDSVFAGKSSQQVAKAMLGTVGLDVPLNMRAAYSMSFGCRG